MSGHMGCVLVCKKEKRSYQGAMVKNIDQDMVEVLVPEPNDGK